MDLLFYLKTKNFIFLVLVSVISFYILKTIDCCTDTFYPYFCSLINNKEKNVVDYQELIKLMIKLILVSFIVILVVHYL